MAYIGRYVGTDKTTKTLKLDSLQSQFNGAQTVFSLKSDGTSVYPSTPQSLILSLNGVVQEPGTAYTISQDTVTFTSAPASNSEFFGVLNGNQADFGYNFGQLNVMDVATFSSNVTVLGTLTVGNSTITINTTTLTAGNTSLNSTGVTIGTTTVTATGLAATNPANTSANGVVTTGTQSFAGDKTFINNMTVTGNLTVLGTAVTLNSENVLIKDNILTLSSNVTGAPVLDAGIEVNRGTSANVAMKWNETSDVWQVTNDGTNYGTVLTTISSTGINASALSTGTVPLARLTSANSSANGVVDTTTQTFAGDKTFTGISAFSANVNFDSGTLFVDAANNRVGMGTTTPETSLHVNGAGDIVTVESTNPTGRSTILFKTSGSDWEIGARGSSGSPNDAFYLYDRSIPAYRAVFCANGNIGIGVTTPTARLNVYGTGLANDPGVAIDISSSASFVHAQESFAAGLTANQAIISVIGKEGSTLNAGYVAYRYSGTSGSTNNLLTFGHWGADHLMVLTGGGNLGLGTLTPSVISNYVSHTLNGTNGSFTEYQQNGGNTFRVGSDLSDGGFIFTQSTTAVRFGTNGAERLRINSDGTIRAVSTIGVGNANGSTSGAGITFPATQSASTNANTLDDYEEGTWTPTLASGGFTSITQNKATYTKIGNRVWYTADFSLVGTGNSNQLQFGGLPFTVIANGWSAGSCYFGSQNTDFWHVAALPYSGTTVIVIQVVSTAGVGSSMLGSNLGASYVNVSGFYEVA